MIISLINLRCKTRVFLSFFLVIAKITVKVKMLLTSPILVKYFYCQVYLYHDFRWKNYIYFVSVQCPTNRFIRMNFSFRYSIFKLAPATRDQFCLTRSIRPITDKLALRTAYIAHRSLTIIPLIALLSGLQGPAPLLSQPGRMAPSFARTRAEPT